MGRVTEQFGEVKRLRVRPTRPGGKYDPMLPLAFKIARAFGKRIEDVFQWEDRP